jgi:DNA-binding HxlR family transcriptional regulator
MSDTAAEIHHSSFCPLYRRAIEIIGRRWTGAIVRSLLTGNVRFSEIRGSIPGLSDRLLSERLKELETEGVVERRVLAQTPVRIEYHLTSKGDALATVVQAVSAWAEEWLTLPTAAAAGAGR